MMHTYSLLLSGFIFGAGFVAFLGGYIMRRFMVVAHESRFGFEETAVRIRNAVEKAEGWGFPVPAWDFSEAMMKKGQPFTGVGRLTLFFICKPSYARNMVDTVPEMASIMPCAWALYEKNGKTWVGSMNIPLMALPFGGVIGKTFGAVGREEEAMLKEIL